MMRVRVNHEKMRVHLAAVRVPGVMLVDMLKRRDEEGQNERQSRLDCRHPAHTAKVYQSGFHSQYAINRPIVNIAVQSTSERIAANFTFGGMIFSRSSSSVRL